MAALQLASGPTWYVKETREQVMEAIRVCPPTGWVLVEFVSGAGLNYGEGEVRPEQVVGVADDPVSLVPRPGT